MTCMVSNKSLTALTKMEDYNIIVSLDNLQYIYRKLNRKDNTMGKTSTKKHKNIYQSTREELGYSRQKVADKIAELNPEDYEIFDENRLTKIELESVNQIHPGEIVTLAKIYNKPELRNHYCCNQCDIGKIDAPKVSYTGGVHEILVSIAVTLKSLNHSKIRLMEILKDEHISEDETKDFSEIYKELNHLSMTVESLKLWCEKRKLTSEKNS